MIGCAGLSTKREEADNVIFALLDLKNVGYAVGVIIALFVISWFVYLWARLIASAILRSLHEYRTETRNQKTKGEQHESEG